MDHLVSASPASTFTLLSAPWDSRAPVLVVHRHLALPHHHLRLLLRLMANGRPLPESLMLSLSRYLGSLAACLLVSAPFSGRTAENSPN